MDIMMYGHFHEGFIIEENGIIFANPGSISLPRGNSKHSYLIFTDKELILKDVDGNIIFVKDILKDIKPYYVKLYTPKNNVKLTGVETVTYQEND